jgi:hypothetical protein
MPFKTRQITFNTVATIVCERARMSDDTFSGVPFLVIPLPGDRLLHVEQVETERVEVALFEEDGACISCKEVEDVWLDQHLRELGLEISGDRYDGSELERQLLHAVTTLAFDITQPNMQFRHGRNLNLSAWPALESAGEQELQQAIRALVDAGRITYAGDDLFPCRKPALAGSY